MTAIDKLPPIPATPSTSPVGSPAPVTPRQPGTSQTGFDTVLDHQIRQSDPVRFSAHAQNRLASRSIHLDPSQIERLQHSVGQAEQKGAQESLVLMDNMAFIVSVKNRTVVTALDNAAQSGHVFTKIDSTVLA